MQQSFPSAFSDVADGSFGHTILEIGIYARIGELLLPDKAVVGGGIVQ